MSHIGDEILKKIEGINLQEVQTNYQLAGVYLDGTAIVLVSDKRIPYEKFENIRDFVEELRLQGYRIDAHLEPHKKSQSPGGYVPYKAHFIKVEPPSKPVEPATHGYLPRKVRVMPPTLAGTIRNDFSKIIEVDETYSSSNSKMRFSMECLKDEKLRAIIDKFYTALFS